MSQAEVDRIVAVGKAYSRDLALLGSFYSWGGENHNTLTLGGRNEEQFRQRYSQAVGGGANAGPGLYLTTSLYDSSDYCPAANGVLLQVEMPDDMPYVRISHAPTMNALRTGNPPVNTQMLYRTGADMPPVLVNHAGTWHCLKTTKGVGIRKFDGRGSDAVTIQFALDWLRGAGRNAAVAVLLGQLRADMRAQVH
jgi:hypothetical protein